MNPKVTLLNCTPDPLETVWTLWDQSKGEGPLRSVQWVKENIPSDEVEKLFRAVVAQRIPIGESIDFIFVLEGVSVSWREQAVRHRIGTKASTERVGSDIAHMDVIPDLADSVFWSQSMRIQNMGTFAKRGLYRVPETLSDKPWLQNGYCEMMEAIEGFYNAMVAAGVPMEDAREIIPLGAQHRMSWKLNMSALQHILSKRGCWILQLGIWGPIIMGMIEELATKVHPIFSEIVTPPCIDANRDQFTGCKYHEECRRRYTGDDDLPPCPLHLSQHVVQNPDVVRLNVHREGYQIRHPDTGQMVELPRRSDMVKRVNDYTKFWNRDCYTGESLL